VLDWELATLGDPLADLGWFLCSWVEPGEWSHNSPGPVPPSTLPGYPSRRWLLERYASASGIDPSMIDFYIAFAYWRVACVNAGVLTRYANGAMGRDGYDFGRLREEITTQAETALRLLSSAPGSAVQAAGPVS
jgi:aminoglycoside phosphotransferase (APT) family kinase protein